ncbi:hypothetical protein [Pseudoprevotella muciniphila]|uniref:hypothetical protein n=1 Tax=Pseudoprevotella muciniphila TaxID=2133944 RepID=UPI000DD0E74B|nr:hypothetical protein [Pseudoprevotella muciniphila]
MLFSASHLVINDCQDYILLLLLTFFLNFVVTPSEEKILKRFETRVRQLMLSYKELQNENASLRNTIGAQRVMLDEKENALSLLQKEYNTLKLARVIDVGSDDLKDAKLRISKLVQEIDKCIAAVNI